MAKVKEIVALPLLYKWLTCVLLISTLKNKPRLFPGAILPHYMEHMLTVHIKPEHLHSSAITELFIQAF